MKFLINDEDRNKSGIYVIRVEGGSGVYVGQAQTLKKRWRNHRDALKEGIHHCPPLQKAFIKYGEAAFTIEVIEFCEDSLLTEREQYYLDTIENLYNICKVAKSARGNYHSETTRLKMSSKKNSSGYPGVSFVKKTGRWDAKIKIKGVEEYLGTFDTPEEASEAYLYRLRNQDLPYAPPLKKESGIVSKTGFKGVYLDPKKTKFCARIKLDGKMVHLGYYDTAEEAHRVYLIKRSNPDIKILKLEPKIRITNKSGYKGVSWDSKHEKWIANFYCEKKRIFLGRHSTPELANEAIEMHKLSRNLS
jgi:group I intron endonuclease